MYVKFYTKSNVYIDTIYEIGNPSTVHTLNGVNKFTFTIPINNIKISENLLRFMNHVYFYDDNDILRFGGVLVDRIFNMPNVTLNCFGWAFLFKKVRMTHQEYETASYSALYRNVYNNYISNWSGLIQFFYNGIYSGADITSTTRLVNNTDFVWNKLTNWNDDINGHLYFTDDRIFVFEYATNQRQMWYAKWEYDESRNILELPTSFNNLVVFPTISQSISESANRVYGETTVKVNDVDTTLTALKTNGNSIVLYGVLDGVASVNDSVVLQSTVDAKTQAELDRISLPSVNMDITISDSILAPIDEIKVGQKITIFIEPYLNFKTETKILEIQRNYTENVAKLTVGKTLYRQNAPQIINYK